jgi:hypothetical protein
MKRILALTFLISATSFASGTCFYTKDSQKKTVQGGSYLRIGEAFCKIDLHEGKTIAACTFKGEEIITMAKGIILISYGSDPVTIKCIGIDKDPKFEL